MKVHLGSVFSCFPGPIGFPYVTALYGTVAQRTASTRFLSRGAQAIRNRHEALFQKECDTICDAFRAALQRDALAFSKSLSCLHPSPKRREVALVLLSKLAHKICRPHSARLRDETGGYGGDFTQDELVAPRFSPAELTELWERFASLEVRLSALRGWSASVCVDPRSSGHRCEPTRCTHRITGHLFGAAVCAGNAPVARRTVHTWVPERPDALLLR